MRMKNNKISIANLNPIFTDHLQKFDLLHKGLMSNEAVVTSVDTGKHWGSVKKEDRPDGWENMTTEQVMFYSDSKHYDIPCDALDFRRRNPDPDNDKNIYYDDLTTREQFVFRTEMNECFPDHIFDIVFSQLCIHVEIDIKPRKLTDEDLEMKQPVVNTMIPDNPTYISRKLKRPKFTTGFKGWILDLFVRPPWKRSGFKRITGGIITTAGTVLSFIPEYSGVGQIVMYVGGVLGLTGIAHGVAKNKKTDNKTQLIKTILLWIVEFIMKRLTKNKEKK